MAYSVDFKKHCYELCKRGLSVRDVSDIEGPSVASVYIWRREYFLREQIERLQHENSIFAMALEIGKKEAAKLQKKLQKSKKKLRNCA